jgi:hypothetical protein
MNTFEPKISPQRVRFHQLISKRKAARHVQRLHNNHTFQGYF